MCHSEDDLEPQDPALNTVNVHGLVHQGLPGASRRREKGAHGAELRDTYGVMMRERAELVRGV